MTEWFLALVGAIALGAPSGAQSNESVVPMSENTLELADGAAPPRARISDLAWLAGHWEGEGLGGESAETWSRPLSDRMYGTYTLTKGHGVEFSEAMLLVEEEGTLVLKLKHFDSDFIGWEERSDHVRFPLVRVGDEEAWFRGLTFRRSGDVLRVFLVLTDDGERSEHEFRFERVPM